MSDKKSDEREGMFTMGMIIALGCGFTVFMAFKTSSHLFRAAMAGVSVLEFLFCIAIFIDAGTRKIEKSLKKLNK